MAKCDYCDTVLERNMTQCPSCGAPVPHNATQEPDKPISSPEMTAMMRMLLPLAHRLVDVLLVMLSIFPHSRRRR